MRRSAIVNIEAMANLEDLNIPDNSPSLERVVMARAELRWVLGLLANLPDRCREVFRARRIYGLSQLETAETLGITEGIVEKESMRGLALISDMIERAGMYDVPQAKKSKNKSAVKKYNVNDQ
jgi:RNA polymerase sigma-70 factor (ECF subfamily)